MGIRLGPFDLHEIAGRGGMGEVWRGAHRALGVPVAVKVLTSANARDETFAEAFRNEARAVAALAHPNIITIFDYGEIAETTGELPWKSPYIVTEWASGGTLAQHPPADFEELRAVLLALLDALAHAHARSVIHRDLKPGNVLRSTELDARAGLKLVDFGIARYADDDGKPTEKLTGTPSYMAPEQIVGASRDEGPWTDLYSLGCVAYRLSSGRLPFQGTAVEIAAGHLQDPVPKLAPAMAVPDGFEGWVRTLLSKEPRARFQLAADAALALRRLGDAPAGSFVPAPPASSPDAATLIATGHSMTSIEAMPPVTIEPARVEPLAHAEMPPIPSEWDAAIDVRAPVLPGTGIGVFGVREIPLVDRAEERDVLWSALRWVAEGGARLVLLHGPSGCGKSRLARWLGERANELGVASVVRVSHDPEEGAIDRLGPATARWLRCEGATEQDARARVAAALAARGVIDEADIGAVLRLVRSESFSGARERYETARRLLVGASAERPLVVWLDDVQWGEDSLAFVQHALDAHDGHGRVVFVATLRDDVPISPGAADLLAALRARPDADDVRVGPLPVEHRAELVRGLLGLEGELATQVEERTAGSPLFAVQLVGNWVERGVLEPATHGYRLRDGARLTIPDDVGHVWQTRIEDVLRARPASDGIALEIASLLGHSVNVTEWEGACALAGVTAPWGLVEKLLDLRFATCGERGPRAGWDFVHGLLREGLERRARAAGRLVSHHRACADILRARGQGELPERLGRHLRASGDSEAALDPLLRGAKARAIIGEGRMATVLLREHEDALREAGIPESDVRWGKMWALAAHVAGQSGSADEAVRQAERAEQGASAHGWPVVRADALVAHARALIKLARPDQAEAAAREALELFRAAGDDGSARKALHWLGISFVERGVPSEARRIHLEALALAERLGDGCEQAEAHYEIGLTERQLGELDTAEMHLRSALELYEAARHPFGIANAYVGLGEYSRQLGDMAAAEDYYRRALVIYDRVGSPNAAIARLNLGLALLARERWVEARRTLDEARGALERSGWRALLACAHVEIATAASAVGDWGARDDHFAKARALLAEGIVADPDLGWAAALAGKLAERAGHRDRAREAWSLAREQWLALGRSDAIAEADAALAKLGG